MTNEERERMREWERALDDMRNDLAKSRAAEVTAHARGIAEERARWRERNATLSATLERFAEESGPTERAEGIRVAIRAIGRSDP